MSKRVVLPNPADYLNYMTGIIFDSFSNDRPTESQLPSIVTVAKDLSNKRTPLILEDDESGS
jgi:hypothetical protein